MGDRPRRLNPGGRPQRRPGGGGIAVPAALRRALGAACLAGIACALAACVSAGSVPAESRASGASGAAGGRVPVPAPAPPLDRQGPRVWLVPDAVLDLAAAGGLKLDDGTRRVMLDAATMAAVRAVRRDLEQQAQVSAALAIVASDSVNAIAWTHEGRPAIGFTLGLLRRAGADRDLLAAVAGHELAHLSLGHSGADRVRRDELARGLGTAVGLLATLAGVPVGTVLTETGALAVTRGFSRAEERAADELGLRWSEAAGYDPCGFVRLARLLERTAGARDTSVLATHPSMAERASAAERRARERGAEGCLQARSTG